MTHALDAHLVRATEILAEMQHMAASQCQNCGMAYWNIHKTHDPRRFPLRPRCSYAPVGWKDSK